MAGRFVPFNDEAGVRSRAGGITGVAAEVLSRDVEAARCRVDLCPVERIPDVAQRKKESECYVRSVSAQQGFSASGYVPEAGPPGSQRGFYSNRCENVQPCLSVVSKVSIPPVSGGMRYHGEMFLG
jgi:hypothetical protein